MSTRTHVEFHHFVCQGVDRHPFTALTRRRTSSSADATNEFRVSGSSSDAWSPVPLCPTCPAIGVSVADIRLSGFPAQIPESERFMGWLSADGSKLSIPGKRDAAMPDRYRVLGYQRVEANSLADLDRLMAIREQQTGNSCSNEMDHSAASRALREDAEPDDDPTTDT